jgi:hypothetical protein
MITYAEARDRIVDYIVPLLAAQMLDYKIFWENTVEVDVNRVGPQFIRVSVDFDLATQAIVGADASDRIDGAIVFKVFQKDGSGARSVLVAFDILREILAFKELENISLGVAGPGRKESHDGWTSWDFVGNFTYFSIN